MKNFISKKELEIILSKLIKFEDLERNDKNSILLEQYSTNDIVASDLLWHIYMNEKNNKNFIDFGCGTGILGIGLLFFDFKIVFVEKDINAIEVLKQNLNFIFKEYEEYFKINNIDVKNNYVIINKDVNDLDEDFFLKYKSFFVVMNPPFGVKVKNADKNFLKVAFNFDKVYSIHNYNDSFKQKFFSFLDSFCKDYGFNYKVLFKKDFVIKKQYSFHKKSKKTIGVIVILYEKKQ